VLSNVLSLNVYTFVPFHYSCIFGKKLIKVTYQHIPPPPSHSDFLQSITVEYVEMLYC